jgi:predicted phage terminase large subunit-like protein
MKLPSFDAIVAEQCRRSYRAFVREAWPHVPHLNGVTYVENWHVAAICEHLEAVARGDIRYLLINQPPRSSKTELTGIFFLPWLWTWEPNWSAIFASVVASASTETSVRCRSLIECSWYQELHTFLRGPDRRILRDDAGDPKHWELRDDKNAKNDFANTVGGSRLATSLDAQIIGKGADLIVGDDLESDKTVQTETGRKNARDYWDGTLSSRAKRPSTVSKILVQQRLGKNDLSWHVLKSGLYTHLFIPNEYNPRRCCVTVIRGREWRDPRTREGELLNAFREPDDVAQRTVAEAKTYGTGMGPIKFAAQHNQDPKTEQGGAFKREWWRFYKDPRFPAGGRPDGCASAEVAPAIDLPRELDLAYLQSVDSAAKAKDSADASCCGVSAYEKASGARVFVRDVAHDRVEFEGLIKLVKGQRDGWKKCVTTYIEDKSSGQQLLQILRPRVPGVVPVDPGNVSKEDRARLSTLPRLEAGQIYLPEGAPWLEYIVGEHADFPHGEHDDSVDMLAQMLSKILVVSTELDFARIMGSR